MEVHQAAIAEMPEQPDQQDHRGIKFRIRPMLGFKNYDCAATTIAGIELLRRIGKNQFSFHRLRVEDQAAPEIWNAVLAAGGPAAYPAHLHQSRSKHSVDGSKQLQTIG